MKVKCSQCNAAFSVDDSKVAGKKFGFDCPKCGSSVVIDNRSQESLAASMAPSFGAVASPQPSLHAAPESSHVFSQQDNLEDDYSYHDEIEPEIDLSVLGLNGSSAHDDLISDTSFDLSGGDMPLTTDDFSLGDASFDQKPASSEDDESITIDLDSLNIDLAEPEEMAPSVSADLFSDQDDLESEKISIGEDILAEADFTKTAVDDDESITLDLDSLDIPLEESDGIIHEGISSEGEDLRLSIDDAGLTLDDVAVGVPLSGEHSEDESLHLTLDEIDDSIDIDDINRFTQPAHHSAQPANASMFDDSAISGKFDSSLPEVDLDRFDTTPDPAFSPAAPVEDRFLDIDNRVSDDGYYSYGDYHAEQVAPSGGGYVDFTIDYALHYSRIKAILRFFGLYYITFIPHFIVGFVYTLITSIINVFNYLIILFSGKRERDYSLLTEHSLRYGVTICASVLNVIEEKPMFAGRKNIDSQLQMNVVYPPFPSRILAFLRLTVIGMLIILIPHILLLSVLSVGMILISFVSLIFTIFAGRWPSIMFDFMIRYLRYYTSVSAFMFGLIDTYPSFRFE